MLKLPPFILLTFMALTACSSNSVKVVGRGEQPVDEVSQRFTNLHTGENDYPRTCQSNCYKSNEALNCDYGICVYTGQYSATEYDRDFVIQWLGHAQFLITTPSGETLLTDPVFKEFDWPINWLHAMFNGNYRLKYPDVERINFDAIDGVLYSHVHYDHFNKSDIETLGTDNAYFVPLKMSQHFPQIGADVYELGWFVSSTLGDTAIWALPAHHFSSRTFIPFIHNDNNRSGWNSWLIESAGNTLFFAGDTGYSGHFSDIHERVGDIDVCLLPIASYYSEESPKWYRYVHMTPEDALTAASDLNCKMVIPWGYGNASWGMGDRSSHSPLRRFLSMLKRLDTDVEVIVLDEKTLSSE